MLALPCWQWVVCGMYHKWLREKVQVTLSGRLLVRGPDGGWVRRALKGGQPMKWILVSV